MYNLTKDNFAFAVGLLVDCPMGNSLGNCPLGILRDRPLKERVDIISKLSEEELLELIEHHKQCITIRELYL